jgi:hypothetical protein
MSIATNIVIEPIKRRKIPLAWQKMDDLLFAKERGT